MQSRTAAPQNVFAFRPRPAHRFSVRERMGLLAWATRAQRFGLSRTVVHGPIPEEAETQGEFLLVYRDDTPWAAYGIGLEAGRYIVWRPADGSTIGLFDDLDCALAAVIAHRTAGSLPLQA